MAAGADVVVVGGGLVGLACAWRAAQRGAGVVLVEAGEPHAQTSAVAAGMLAPAAELEVGEAGRRLLALGLEAAARWPAVARELDEATGLDVGLRETGTLVLARDRDEAEALERELSFHRDAGLAVERLLPSAARRREPALAPSLRLALDVPGDHAIDPLALASALLRAAVGAGARVRAGARVEALEPGGVRLAGGERVAAGRTVLAAGAWSRDLAPGLADVRPVKGQVLRLRDPRGPGLAERVLRWDGGYLVPRGDGRYVLGATMEERGFDTTVTAGAIHDLLRDAAELVPDVRELELEGAVAGLRPTTPDNVPLIGPVDGRDDLLLATGHGRNGVLLCELTAHRVAEALSAESRAVPA